MDKLMLVIAIKALVALVAWASEGQMTNPLEIDPFESL